MIVAVLVGTDVGTEREENKEEKNPQMAQSILAFLCSVELAVKTSYESEKLLTSAVMFWLKSDSEKTLRRSAWLAYGKLKLSSIVSQGSMKIDFLLYSA